MRVLGDLRPLFAANTYDLVGKNCNHFSELLITRLGMSFPSWVNRAAKLGNFVRGGVDPIQEERVRQELLAKQKQEQDRKRAVQQEQQKVMEVKRQALKPEPPAEGEGVVHVQINCPNGAKAKRRFLSSDSVGDVLQFVRAFDLSLENTSFHLRSNYPRKEFRDQRLTLAAAGQ
jgi:hypothetical protein